MKKLLVLTSLLALGACSTGTGGGDDMDVRHSNWIISSSIDNETRRSAHIANTLGEDYYNGTRNRDGTITSCGGERTCNDVAFENMRYWLINNINTIGEWVNDDELRDALIVAGFGSKIGDNWEETKTWVQNNASMIKRQAQEIYNELGLHQEFDITQSKLSVLNGIDYTTTEPSTMAFKLDGNNKITGIVFHDSVGSCGGLDYPGVRKRNSTWFTIDGDAHIYKLDNIVPQYQGWWRSYIEVKSSESLSLAQMKEKMIEYADEELDKGSDGFFGTFIDGTPQEIYDALVVQINEIDSWDDVSYSVYNHHMDMDLQSFGKYVGLAYSDFGKLMIPNPSTPDAHLMYHGGYEDKLVSNEHLNEIATDPETDMTFHGRAVGKVANKKFRTSTDMDVDAIMLAGDVTLNFKGSNDGATETMLMEFPDWYDVTVTKTPDSNSINFANYTNNDEQFKFHRQDEGFLEEHTMDDFIGQGYGIGALQVNYYADQPEWNPSEASGYISYGENGSSPYEGYETRSLEFQSTFGTIRDWNETQD